MAAESFGGFVRGGFEGPRNPREEKKVGTVLFLIESQVSSLVFHARKEQSLDVTEEIFEERELAFLESFALGKDPPLRPTIQNIEHYAQEWAYLVPDSWTIRAALAHRLGDKYEFKQNMVPSIRVMLGIDEPEFSKAYWQLYHEAVERIYDVHVSLAARVRWMGSAFNQWVENLPPFWKVYSLTVREIIGTGILVLPIAVASFGLLWSLALLIVLGLISMLSVRWVAEAVARSGPIRYGSAFFGRLAEDYLGRLGANIVTALLIGLCLLGLPAYFLGISSALSDISDIPPILFVLLIAPILLYLVRKFSLTMTIASALIVGALNVFILILFILFAIPHVTMENVVSSDILGGSGSGFFAFALIFGVAQGIYFGHLAAGICGRVVLNDDPSGRSLIRGSFAAQVTAVVFYCLFVFAVNGAVPPSAFIGEVGTMVAPFAATVGPFVQALGLIYIILALGLGSLAKSRMLFRLLYERLPSRSSFYAILDRRQSMLRFTVPGRGPLGGLSIGVGFVGIENESPRFYLEVERDRALRRREISVNGRWDVLATTRILLGDHGERSGGRAAELILQVDEANRRQVRVHIATTLRSTYEGSPVLPGWGPRDLLALSETESDLLIWVARHGEATKPEIRARLGEHPDTMEVWELLLERGLLVESTSNAGRPIYMARPNFRRSGRLPDSIRAAIDDQEVAGAATELGERTLDLGRFSRLRHITFSKRGRYLLALIPVLATFMAAAWMVLADFGSFTQIYAFAGAVIMTVAGGLLPPLLVTAARRKGEYIPSFIQRALGRRLWLVACYFFYLISIFFYGLAQREHPVQLSFTFLIGMTAFVVTVVLIRRGAFWRRLIVEWKQNEITGRSTVTVTMAGKPHLSEIRLRYNDGEEVLSAAHSEISRVSALREVILRPIEHELTSALPREGKVLIHRITRARESVEIPSNVSMRNCEGDEWEEFKLTRKVAIFPLKSPTPHMRIRFRQR